MALLDSVRVVEVATFVLGPAAGTVMADFGAEVVHVEHPTGGDAYRQLFRLAPLPPCERNYPWMLTSRNKRSVALQLKNPTGREVLLDLIGRADVFLTNYHPSVLQALGLRYEDLAPRNPRLVYAHATGFGDAGTEAEKPGYDATAWWASSGLMDAVRPRQGEHALAAPGMGDQPSAMALFGAIMLALYARERSGRGRCVKTSLLANGAWSNGIYLQAALCGAPPFAHVSHAETPNALVNTYTCADGRAFYLAMVQERVEWSRFTEAIGRPELREDPRFAELEQRRAHARELTALLDDVFAEKPLDQWRALLDRHGVTFGAVARTEELPGDAQMRANAIFRPIEGDPDGTFTVDSPIQVEGESKRPCGPAPEVGEHTLEVLGELGYGAERIETLRREGVIGAA